MKNAIPEEQELLLLRGGHYDLLTDKVGLKVTILYLFVLCDFSFCPLIVILPFIFDRN